MNELAVRRENSLAISIENEELIKAGVAENTLKAYGWALEKLEAWINDGANAFRLDGNGNGGHGLNDAVLAEYITELHQQGKSPATIAQVVAAVKWSAKNRNRKDVAGAITERTLAGLRDSAMINLMSDCLLRISEVVAVNAREISKGVRSRLNSVRRIRKALGAWCERRYQAVGCPSGNRRINLWSFAASGFGGVVGASGGIGGRYADGGTLEIGGTGRNRPD